MKFIKNLAKFSFVLVALFLVACVFKTQIVFAEETDSTELTETLVTTYEVATKAELVSAIASAKEGEIVKLTANIDYGSEQLKIEKAITLDLGGKILTNTFGWGGIALKNNCSIINGTIDHKGGVAAIKAWNVDVLKDLTITVAERPGKIVGGIVVQEGSTVRINKIENVVINGKGLTNGIQTNECGNATEDVIGSMNNVTIEANETGMLISAPCGTASNCNIKGGVSGIELWIKGTYSATLDLVNCKVEGNSQALYIHDEFSDNTSIVNDGLLKLTTDSATTYESSTGFPLKYEIARAENLSFDEEILAMIPLNGEGTESDPYTIANINDLKQFRDNINIGHITYKGKYIKLTSNIDLNNEEWTPIGNSTNKFQGTFDGNGYTISNLEITGRNSNVGLFGYTINGEIKNLTVHNASVSGRLNVGVVSGNPYTSKYTNIKVTGHVEVNGMAYVGAVGGKNAYANWTDIIVDVDDSSYVKANSIENGVAYRTYVGGVIGFMGEGGHSFTNVVSNIDVYGSTCDIGGITGIAHYGNSFINCISSGNIYVTNAVDPVDYAEVGGIAGVWHNGGSPVTIENCIFMGKIYKEESDGTKSILKDSCITGVAYSSTGTGELVAKDNQIISIEVNEKINLYVNEDGKIYFDLPANSTKEGYTFEAWYDDENFTNKITSSIEVVDNFKATNYTIKWIPIEYTIEFDSNGGSAVENITYTIEDTKDLGEPTKTGYNFVGWYENDKLVENIKVGTYGNKSLVAKWEATEYIISFDSNGGSAVESIVYTIEEELSITANPTLKHYTFTGWYNENNELVKNIKVGTYGNKTLVAKWQAVEYTITFESNGGNLVESIKYTVESDTVVLPATTSSYANHNFLGWYDVKGYEVTTINASTGKDVTVYAKWTHTFGEWKKIQESTTDEPGKEMQVCECGANEIKRTPVKTFNDIFGDFFDKLVNLINSFFEKLNNIINSLQNNPNDEETKEQATEDLYGLYFGDKE